MWVSRAALPCFNNTPFHRCIHARRVHCLWTRKRTSGCDGCPRTCPTLCAYVARPRTCTSVRTPRRPHAPVCCVVRMPHAPMHMPNARALTAYISTHQPTSAQTSPHQPTPGRAHRPHTHQCTPARMRRPHRTRTSPVSCSAVVYYR